MGGGRTAQAAPHSLSGCHPSFRAAAFEISLAPGYGNHAHARACACATTATSHAWALTRLHEDTEGVQENSKYILMIYIIIISPVISVNYDSAFRTIYFSIKVIKCI